MQYEMMLSTDRFNQRFEQIEEQLTALNDLMDLLEEQQAQIGEKWQGEAENTWLQYFQMELQNLKELTGYVALQAEFMMRMACSFVKLDQIAEETANM